MKTTQAILTVALALTAAFAQAQAWSDAYDKAVKAANSGQWAEARDAFKEATASRAEDSNKPTNLGGSLLERTTWRDGALYSPNFGAAYAIFRQGMAATDGAEATRLLTVATQEGEALVAKGQASQEIVHVLVTAYTKLGAMGVEGAADAAAKAGALAGKAHWRVDNSFVAPTDMGGAKSTEPQQTSKPTATKVNKPAVSGIKGNSTFYRVKAGDFTSVADVVADPTEKIPAKADKFALVIGNGESRVDELKMDYAPGDAEMVRNALVDHAGYMPGNVSLLTNASASQIMTAAQELAARVPEYGTVTIYFTGVAANLDGKDYLAGVGANSVTDTSQMVAKMDLFRTFMQRGARIFAFFQVNRENRDGNVFGTEIPRVGQISQMQATLPGTTVTAVTNGKETHGAFTNAFTSVLTRFHTNTVPLFEFAWQVFYNMRRGGNTGVGGGSEQTPTLPVLSNLSSDAPF
ncbi:MAG: hypothetical protein KF857_00625 [Fimbriimonadaceae bacterium]|nr:hypothetical protein [Fimbriimonadaceae bacterium]